MVEPKFIEVHFDKNIFLLNHFLNSAGKSLETFRYFGKRSVEVVKRHTYTVILQKEDEVIGYGHLDPEDEKYWLGICISETYLGLGYGQILLDHLIKEAERLKLNELFLSVDTDNISAKKLYSKFGFSLIKAGKIDFYKKTMQVL